MNVLGTLAILCAVLSGLVLLVLKRFRLLGVLLLIVGVGATTYILQRGKMYGLASNHIVLGASSADVISALGVPSRITDGSEWVEPGVKRNAAELIPGCVEEYWYGAFFFPYQEAFCFDSNHKLIARQYYNSW